tara:strand:+ start:74 stop:337 length:264 start_codon:yes stop_codon:yes gene_type:complete
MSNIDNSKRQIEKTIVSLEDQINNLKNKLSHLSTLEVANSELTAHNSHLENEIKILKSDFIELKNFAGSISDQLDQNIYTIKDILDS